MINIYRLKSKPIILLNDIKTIVEMVKSLRSDLHH